MSVAPAAKKTKPSCLSIIVPVYDEELNIEPFYQAIVPILDQLPMPSELIFVDDGSKDQSPEIIKALARQDSRVRGLSFSRNFGSHAAFLAGLRSCQGDAAIIISVDLQDPPEMIPRLIEKWQEGSEVVWAVRQTRDDPFFKKLFARIFYFIIRKIALPNYPPGGMDFGLFDRKVIEALKDVKEANQFILGLILWLGFRQTQVLYHRTSRRHGVSKWPFWKRFKAAVDAIVSFSYFPIRFISYFGLLISVLSLLYAGVLIVNRIFFGWGGAGWPSMMVAIFFLGGIQLVTLGVLGEYIWRGTDQVKGRPQYIIAEKINF